MVDATTPQEDLPANPNGGVVHTTTPPGEDGPSAGSLLAASLLDTEEVDALFQPAAALAGVVWLLLLALMYGLTPRDQLVHLAPEERLAALIAFIAMAVTNTSAVLNFFYYRATPLNQSSGVVRAGFLVVGIAMITNALLCFAPTVVLVDPVTHARVYVLRWVEWTPLGGLMTFMSEVVDVKKGRGGLKASINSGLLQSVSIFCGLLLPLCYGIHAWAVVLVVSCVTYLTIFPRCFLKRRAHHQGIEGSSFLEQEYRDRIKFASSLLTTCAVVWTVLVCFYFINMVIFMTLPEGHPIRRPSLPMILDTSFDVLAKSLYMQIIVAVHESVFSAQGRAERQMAELRGLMRVLWTSSSDCIVISVRNGKSKTALFSPALPVLVASDLPKEVQVRDNLSIMVELSETQERLKTTAHFVESKNLEMGKMENEIIYSIDAESTIAKTAEALMLGMWGKSRILDDKEPSLFEHHILTGGEQKSSKQCEMKVSPHSNNARIGIVRDISERYRILEAERTTHSESVARHQEAQQINRFTRHEVKNGILAAIELCDNIEGEAPGHGSGDDNSDTLTFGGSKSSLRSGGMGKLEKTLHEILDTVLAESMARELIHETYQLRRERIDVKGLLTSLGICNDISERFQVSLPDLPLIRLDPQLLRHILRNALSNACKYGKKDGTIETVVSFVKASNELVVHVINEPGDSHSMLIAMGDAARNAVFAQGSRLHARNNLSSGDGAWIMQKCAKNLGGNCDIDFSEEKTTFTLRCPVEAFYVTEWDTREFEVPTNTWALAIDDSKVQRRMLSRILKHLGFPEERCSITGEHLSDLTQFEHHLLRLMKEYPHGRFLVLVDENLDYNEQQYSGSIMAEKMLTKMNQGQRSRVLALVRSANDASQDVSLYSSRTDGFLPKQAMTRERVREIIAPFWAEKFLLDEQEDLTETDMDDSERFLLELNVEESTDSAIKEVGD